ncbi:MAG TPA: Asp-tRNA(Asn)/Glu-tRNA(Gln) amidotransferase subunit GatC [Spirochaetota bacterium]|nr:Asp-tRNA(Asn)/Glu-tRNA(Gln) amidotransferase subunit GatC [Spirochaetota bacterium]
MSIDISIVERTAELSRLHLDEDEKKQFVSQISDILEYVEKINTLDTSEVEPTDHIIDNVNVFRDDEIGTSLNHDDIKHNAPQFDRGHFVVPKIIE